jgi:pimeloyl-ACP methyl ester carboxylesterase
MAAADTDDARKFFLDHFDKPKRTLLHGASYGGLVGSKLLETYGKNYDGAFFNSGAIGGAEWNYQFRVDLAAVYQYYCKNLPRPGEAHYDLWLGLPPESKLTMKDVTPRIDECTGISHPAAERSETQKRNLANILSVIRIPERMLIRHMQAVAFTLRDVTERMGKGKSAFGNRDVRYHGSSDDAALNAGVARFDADPAAVAALKADGVPKGMLPVPVVSIHSLNDPQAAVEAQYEYRKAATDSGNGGKLVQAYTDENVHVGQSAPEMAASIDALMQWVEKGTKPSAQTIADSCMAMTAKFQGPCRYHPDYQPKPYNTRFARAQ